MMFQVGNLRRPRLYPSSYLVAEAWPCVDQVSLRHVDGP